MKRPEQLRLFEPREPRRSQRGAELVEFALVFPVLMLFVIAALSLLWTGFIKVASAQAAKEAARDASVPVQCDGSVGNPLITVPTIPDVPNVNLATTTTSITLPDVPTVPTTPTIPGGQAQGATIQPQLKLASAVRQLPIATTVPTLPVTTPTLPVTLPTSTTTTAAPTTTTTAAPTTTTTLPVTIPTTTSTTAGPTTTTTPPTCTPDFRTYPKWETVSKRINGRVPLFDVGQQDLDIVYSYYDANCPSGRHTPPENGPETLCPTPAPNDPPANARVEVTVSKDLPAPVRFFSGIFGMGDKVTAHAGGGTRGE